MGLHQGFSGALFFFRNSIQSNFQKGDKMSKPLIISLINLQPLSGNLFPSFKKNKIKEQLKGSLYRKGFAQSKIAGEVFTDMQKQ